MEIYPSIDTRVIDAHIFAFDKIDGSNIRAEWSRKNGFTKFGSRRRLLDESDPLLGEAIGLFKETYDDTLNELFRKLRYQKATAFLEFAGKHSFAGFHEDEPHALTLFDVHVYKQGLLTPQEFLKEFGRKVPVPPVLYEGKANEQFIESVRKSTLEGMTFEGVVCKGGLNKHRQPNAFKIKSEAWLNKLKIKYGEGTSLFDRLK